MKRGVPGSTYDAEDDDDGASSCTVGYYGRRRGLMGLLTQVTDSANDSVIDEDGFGDSKRRRRSTRLSGTPSDAPPSSRRSGLRASKGGTAGKGGRKKR